MPDPVMADYAAYVDRTAEMLGITIAPNQRQGVIDNVMRTAAIAQLVMEFPLPPDLEAAPQFEPFAPVPETVPGTFPETFPDTFPEESP
jgi:hypothetical protein